MNWGQWFSVWKRTLNNLIENLLLCAAAYAFLTGIRFFYMAIYHQPRKDWDDE